MNKISNKNKLSKNLKIVSIASAVIVCSTILSGVHGASANPFKKVFGGFRGGLKILNNTTPSGLVPSQKLKLPSKLGKNKIIKPGGRGKINSNHLKIKDLPENDPLRILNEQILGWD